MIAQTPWIERKFEFNYPVGLFPVIVERLRGTIPRLQEMIRNVDEKKLNYKPGEKWSVKEIIGHLSDLEDLWIGRIEDFLENKEVLRAADMTNTRTTESHHNETGTAELFVRFKNAREKLLNIVKDMDEETASRSALHPRLKQHMRLIDSLYFAAEHDDHELTKIRNLLS
jgi:uncharacterized damage-inducible protein DinB